MAAQTRSRVIPSFLTDIRVIQAVGQFLFLVLVVIAFTQIANNVNRELRANNLNPNFTFLQNRAGFLIGEAPEWYTPDSSYGTAFQVGMINTLRVITVGLVMATALGILIGVFLLSTNWLIRTISRVYVEILRNTPLLVQLFVWYFIVMFSLPRIQDAIALPAEGVTIIPLRLLFYALAFFIIRRAVRRDPPDSVRGVRLLFGLGAFAFVTEIAFALYHNNPAWSTAYGGSLSDPGFLAYVAVSVLLIAGAALGVSPAWRPHAVGATIGQFAAGLIFYLGITPDWSLRFEVFPSMYISVRGFVFPELMATGRFSEWLAFVVLGVILAGIIWYYFGRLTETTGQPFPRLRYVLIAVVGLTVIGWILVSVEPGPPAIPVTVDGQVVQMPVEQARAQGLLTRQDELFYSQSPLMIATPERQGLRFVGGTTVSPEYMALLLGLVIYTSAFIAEIVRAGIQAVPFGQIEAARALGLSAGETLTKVILPQALRVIIPPLGNQYLNLSKNSSLALAIAYADVLQVTQTMMNQSGQSITGFTMVMIFYLVLSLTISLAMNWVNSRFQLVTR